MEIQALLFKVIELIFSGLCIALIVVKDLALIHPLLTAGTFVGFAIILGILIIALVINHPVEKRLDMIISIVGVCLFMASGAVIIDYYNNTTTLFNLNKEYKNYGLALGSMAIIDAVVFLVDLVFTFRR